MRNIDFEFISGQPVYITYEVTTMNEPETVTTQESSKVEREIDELQRDIDTARSIANRFKETLVNLRGETPKVPKAEKGETLGGYSGLYGNIRNLRTDLRLIIQEIGECVGELEEYI